MAFSLSISVEKLCKNAQQTADKTNCRNNQNNLVDSAWFGRENVFNTEAGQTWVTTKEKIVFPQGKTWQDYVRANRMEISCGEAPYLASRYDTVTGKWIEVKDRIGILDRKIRIIN